MSAHADGQKHCRFTDWGLKIVGVCIIAFTAHLGGFLSGVNGPG